VEAVLFDFGGTLDADGVPWKERFHRLCVDEGLTGLSPARFDRAFYDADDALVGAIPSTLSFRDTVGRLADGVTAALRPADPRLAARIAARFAEEVERHTERNRPFLARLAERYRLGIVSNFYGNLLTVCDNLGIRPLCSVIVDSAQVGFTKPDPRIFRHAVDGLGLPTSAVTFVGDSLPRDMEGARTVGMRHVWLAGDGSERCRPCCPDDRVVSSFLELEALLL
jgi:putative hydrolase of the HAD superfamily